jgi:hypothetical protein
MQRWRMVHALETGALGSLHFDHVFSLSLAMGLTTIWVCPPKYAQVWNPYF